MTNDNLFVLVEYERCSEILASLSGKYDMTRVDTGEMTMYFPSGLCGCVLFCASGMAAICGELVERVLAPA